MSLSCIYVIVFHFESTRQPFAESQAQAHGLPPDPKDPAPKLPVGHNPFAQSRLRLQVPRQLGRLQVKAVRRQRRAQVHAVQEDQAHLRDQVREGQAEARGRGAKEKAGRALQEAADTDSHS